MAWGSSNQNSHRHLSIQNRFDCFQTNIIQIKLQSSIIFLANAHTAIEVWMLYCIISTFLILLQNGLVMLIARHLEEKSDLKSIFKVGKPRGCQRGPTGEAAAKQAQEKVQHLVKIIDKISFGGCVASLLIFNLVFWTSYADKSPQWPSCNFWCRQFIVHTSRKDTCVAELC